jgi:pimeloyl-ACP methyl ester carboxylesterase
MEFQELGPSYRAGNPAGTAAWIEREQRSLRAEFVLQKTAQPLTWKLVDTLEVPVLLITGEADLYTPPAILRIQAGYFRQSEMHVIAEAGHHPEWEQPEAFNRIVLAFLGKHPS